MTQALRAAAVLLALSVPTAFGQSAWAQEADTRQWSVPFSAPDADDAVTARIVGDENGESVMLLTVHDKAGRLIFDASWPMSWYHGNIPGPEGRYTHAQALNALTPRIAGDVSDLPSAAEIAADPEADGGFTWLMTDPETYERARSEGGALLCYSIAHESGACAWYDVGSGYGVELKGSGV